MNVPFPEVAAIVEVEPCRVVAGHRLILGRITSLYTEASRVQVGVQTLHYCRDTDLKVQEDSSRADRHNLLHVRSSNSKA